MTRMLQAAALLCLLLPRLSSAQDWMPKIPQPLPAPLAADATQTTIHRLANGLTIYLSPNAQEPRVSAQIAVRAGSKNDPSDSTGMAHYLEHMLFKGSTAMGTLDYEKEKPHLERISALYEKLFLTKDPAERQRIYKEIDAENIQASRIAVPNEIAKAYRLLGFQGLNAYTSDEQTVYVCNFPANRAEAWAKLESNRFANPVFRLFQNEIETVYEEKNRSMDNAQRLIGEELEKLLYKVHPYGQQTTLGSIEHLKNPSLKKMYAFYDKNYIPNNMAIALAGDFDRKEMLALLEKHFGSWKPKPLPAAKTWALPAPKGVERAEVKYEAEEQAILAWPTVASGHGDEDALIVLDMLMDNASSGIINLKLVQAQKVKGAGSWPNMRNDAGAWHMWVLPKQGQTLEQAEALLLESVESLKRGEFTDEDIKAIITNFEVGEKGRLESNEARVSLLVNSFVGLEPWSRTVERMDRLRRVTKADVLRVAGKYLGPDRVVVYRRNGKPELPSITKPQFTKVELQDGRESKFFSELINTPAKPLQPKWVVEGRDYTITPLPQGRLYAAKNPMNDLFSLSFHFDLGSKHQRNLCAALDLLELSGAGTLTAEEYKKKLYALGSSIGSACSEQGTSVSLSGLNENLWPTLELMTQHFEAPNIASDTLKKMVDVWIGAHQDNKKEPGYVHGALGDWAERGKDSAILDQLTDAELGALKTDQLRGLINRLFDYKRRVGYVGTRSPGEVGRLIEDSRKAYKEPPAYKPMVYIKPAATRLLFTHRDMVQSRVGIFAPDEVLDPEHAVDYQYFSSYLGGGMSALIFQEIREARSLAYSAGGGYSSGSNKGDEGALYGQLGCQADKTAEATELLQRLLKEPPLAEKRFTEVTKAIEEGYRTNPLNFRSIPGSIMSWEDQGLSSDPRPQRFEKALRYKLTDLGAFAARFKGRPLSIYILGHRDRVGLEQLKALGPLEEKTLEQIFPY